MKAELTSYNQAPRKVRLVTELVKGKKVPEALAALSFLPKRSSLPIAKLIQSAAANAINNNGEKMEDLRVENITVNSAGMLVRLMPRAMGRGAPIRRRKSRVLVTLSSTASIGGAKPAVKTVKAKPVKAPAKSAAKKTAKAAA
jgi:large subunit ribosomal protein L22